MIAQHLHAGDAFHLLRRTSYYIQTEDKDVFVVLNDASGSGGKEITSTESPFREYWVPNTAQVKRYDYGVDIP